MMVNEPTVRTGDIVTRPRFPGTRYIVARGACAPFKALIWREGADWRDAFYVSLRDIVIVRRASTPDA